MIDYKDKNHKTIAMTTMGTRPQEPEGRGGHVAAPVAQLIDVGGGTTGEGVALFIQKLHRKTRMVLT